MDSRVPITGAVATSFGAALSWLCCLPLALGAFGSGAAVIATAAAPYRTFLIGLSVACLVFAHYGHHRGKACQDRSCASPKSLGRQRIVLWIATALTLAMISAGLWSSWIIYWFL